MRVVCIIPIVSDFEHHPQVGEIYTVIDHFEGEEPDTRHFYVLKEFTQINPITMKQVAWWSAKFRPVDFLFGERIAEKIEKLVKCEPLTA